MTRTPGARLVVRAAVLAVLLTTLGCNSGGDDMKSTEAAERLRKEAAQLAERLGDTNPEKGRDEYLTCKPNVYDGNVYYTYSVRAELNPDARTLLEDEIVPEMEEQGWTLRKRDSESYTAYDFDKDGFIVGATIPKREDAKAISVGGSSPCVEDDGSTGIIHDA
jgi:hypothetical protein